MKVNKHASSLQRPTRKENRIYSELSGLYEVPFLCHSGNSWSWSQQSMTTKEAAAVPTSTGWWTHWVIKVMGELSSETPTTNQALGNFRESNRTYEHRLETYQHGISSPELRLTASPFRHFFPKTWTCRLLATPRLVRIIRIDRQKPVARANRRKRINHTLSQRSFTHYIFEHEHGINM